jgi:hypothetical protein
MSDLHITVKGQKRLLTAGKRHTHNIVVTAEGGDDYYDAFWDGYQENGSTPAQEAPKPKFCSNCGAPANGGKFCQNCGSKLG